MDNLFEQAIHKNEGVNFLLGKDDYFIPDREVPATHGFMQSWSRYLLPLSEGADFGHQFWASMKALLEYEADPNHGLFAATRHLSLYLQHVGHNVPRRFLETLAKKWELLEPQLRQDKRWTGVDWNTKDGGGLATAIGREFDRIREKFGVAVPNRNSDQTPTATALEALPYDPDGNTHFYFSAEEYGLEPGILFGESLSLNFQRCLSFHFCRLQDLLQDEDLPYKDLTLALAPDALYEIAASQWNKDEQIWDDMPIAPTRHFVVWVANNFCLHVRAATYTLSTDTTQNTFSRYRNDFKQDL